VKTIRNIAELRAELAVPRRSGERIGLVPTMGAFHDGHLALMRRARAECDLVVVSLFVNPTQFNEGNDLAAYPRDEQHDAELALGAGVDYLFTPSVEEVDPAGFATTIHVAGVTEPLEGASRGDAHFDGVATVVTKLLNIVAPDIAYFGQKDAQQAVVIRRLVTDLNIPVQIEVAPTVREADGLAMSSRNVRLSPAQRAQATALHSALQFAAGRSASGETDPGAVAAEAREQLAQAGVATEYFEIVDADTLAPLERLGERPALALVAAVVGDTRLIDNQPLTTED
jgi:pantoate--beta-alanine ligase